MAISDERMSLTSLATSRRRGTQLMARVSGDLLLKTPTS